MRPIVFVTTVLLAITQAKAQPMPAPGTQRTDWLFREADVVCTCKLVASYVESEEPVRTNRTLQHIRGVLEVYDVFKPATLHLGDRLPIRFDRIPGDESVGGDPRFLEPLEVAILFLKKTPDGTYQFSDYWFGINEFRVIPPASGGTGMARLQSALLNILDQAPPGGPYHDDLRALYLLEGFPTLSPEGNAYMVRVANSPDPNIALAAIGTIMKSRKPEAVDLVRNYLENYKGEEPMSVWSIGAWLGQIDDPKALPSLEALSGSRFLSVQLGAMDALRKIKSPSSAPALIQRLDDPNKVVRYKALITLAEAFGKRGESAPSMEVFDRDPERYVSLWKSWWAEQSRSK